MKITGLYTHEPPRADEFPLFIQVGGLYLNEKVSSITPVVWHGQHWFDVWGAQRRLTRINASAVAQLFSEPV